MRETNNERSSVRRWLARVVAGSLALTIAIETCPRQFWGAQVAKEILSPVTARTGLWQGEWPLFAPDPVLNNAWLSAELTAPDGTLETWNSTYWASSSGWDKFRHFRMMNYANRIATRKLSARRDLAAYLLRDVFHRELTPLDDHDPGDHEPDDLAQHPLLSANPKNATPNVPGSSNANLFPEETSGPEEQRWRLVLYRNRMDLALPDDGSLPSRDETTWILSSRPFLIREYRP